MLSRRTQLLHSSPLFVSRLSHKPCTQAFSFSQALVRLDEAAVRRRGRGPLGRLDPLFLSSAAAGRARHLLRRWSGGRLLSRATPQGGAVASGGLRYSQVLYGSLAEAGRSHSARHPLAEFDSVSLVCYGMTCNGD